MLHLTWWISTLKYGPLFFISKTKTHAKYKEHVLFTIKLNHEI